MAGPPGSARGGEPGVSLLQTILAFLLALGPLIVVHELGHFAVARACGVKVLRFSLGFGRVLVRWHWGRDGTEWALSAIPLGGYVKMAGEIGGDGSATSGLGEGRPPLPDEFPGKTIPQRFLIAVAGVVMNVIAAIVCLTVAYGIGYKDTPAVVGDVIPGGPAWAAGVQSGDRLVAYDGQRLRTFSDLKQEVVLAPRGEEATLELERDGRPVTVRLAPTRDASSEFQGLKIYPVSELTLRGADGTELRLGATDVAVVHGRRVVGGRAAFSALEAAAEARLIAVVVEGPAGQRVTVPLRPAGTEARSGPFKLGVSPYAAPVVVAVRGAAKAAGLAVGDELVAADGAPVRTRADLWVRDAVAQLTVRRAGVETPLQVALADAAAVAAFVGDLALAGTAPPAKGAPLRLALAGSELPGGESPAAVAGILPGDTIVSIGGRNVTTWDELLAAGKSLDGTPVSVAVRTGDAPPRTLEVTPRRVVDAGTGKPSIQGANALTMVPVEGAADALGLGLKRTVSEIRNVFRTIARFFTGDISFSKNVSGPVTIATISSSAASVGLSAFLVFLAFISVNLAVLNVLPIPVLDGGTMMFLLIEAVRRKRLSDAAIGRMQLAGFALLMLLMVFALKNDVTNLFGG